MSDLENVKPKADDVEGHMILPLDDEIIPRNATDKIGRPPRRLVDYDDVEGHEHKSELPD